MFPRQQSFGVECIVCGAWVERGWTRLNQGVDVMEKGNERTSDGLLRLERERREPGVGYHKNVSLFVAPGWTNGKRRW